MIAIIGSSHDDILYFDSIMSNKNYDKLLKRYEMITGTIFNQEVVVVYGVYTSILASSITMAILDKYYIDLVIVVGRCYSLNKAHKPGDIIIGTEVINVDVDQIDHNDVLLGQIPTLPKSFIVQKDLITYLEEGFNKRTFTMGKRGLVLSTNDLSNKAIDIIAKEKTIYNANEVIIDSTSGGVAVACFLHEVPFAVIKAIEKVYGVDWDVENYLKVLNSYIDMDKAVTAMIGDIGRNDVLYGGN